MVGYGEKRINFNTKNTSKVYLRVKLIKQLNKIINPGKAASDPEMRDAAQPHE